MTNNRIKIKEVKNIKIIGTDHLVGKEEIMHIIKNINPDVIGIEACKTRFKLWTNQMQQIDNRKNDNILNKISEKIKEKADEEGLDYGADMKTAMFYAINNNIPLLLLDKDIMEIQKEMQSIPLEETIFLQKELIKYEKEGINKKVDENEVIKTMKDKIPISYKILVEDRNKFISKKIKEGIKKYLNKKILIFLGRGHIDEVMKNIENEV